MSNGTLLRFLLGLGLLASGLAAPSAQADPAWLAPQSLTPEGASSWTARVAMDREGTAIAAWSRTQGSARLIEAAVRPARVGVWGATVLASGGSDTGYPELAFDPAGNALVAWTEGAWPNYSVRAAFRPRTGAWQPAETVAPNAYSVALDMDANGNVVAIWRQDRGSYGAVQAAVRTADTGTWSPPYDLSTPGRNSWNGSVAMNGRGDAVAVWTQSFEGFPIPLTFAAFRPAGGEWGQSRRISLDEEDAVDPAVALDEAGNAIAIWTWVRPGSEYVQASGRPFETGEWDYPQSISVEGGEIRGENIEVDGAGNAVALWWHDAPYDAPSHIQAAIRPAGGWWPQPENLSLPNTAMGYKPDLEVNEIGDAFAVWTRAGSPERVQASVRRAGTSSWTPSQIISATEQYASCPGWGPMRSGMRLRSGIRVSATPASFRSSATTGPVPLSTTSRFRRLAASASYSRSPLRRSTSGRLSWASHCGLSETEPRPWAST